MCNNSNIKSVISLIDVYEHSSTHKNVNFTIDDVCFVIDSQGYYLRDRFYPKEVAIRTTDFTLHFVFELPKIKDLTLTEKKTIHYCLNSIHGLEWNDNQPALPLETFEIIINNLYKKYSTTKKRYIVCKNNQLQKLLLDNTWLPIVNYNGDVNFENPSIVCKLNHKGQRCALKKVENIYNDLSSSKK